MPPISGAIIERCISSGAISGPTINLIEPKSPCIIRVTPLGIDSSSIIQRRPVVGSGHTLNADIRWFEIISTKQYDCDRFYSNDTVYSVFRTWCRFHDVISSCKKFDWTWSVDDSSLEFFFHWIRLFFSVYNSPLIPSENTKIRTKLSEVGFSLWFELWNNTKLRVCWRFKRCRPTIDFIVSMCHREPNIVCTPPDATHVSVRFWVLNDNKNHSMSRFL